MLTIDRDWVAVARDHRYRRTPERRVQTIEAAEDFINDVGFAFLWPIKGVEAPNLFHAIAGRARDVPMAHDDPDLSLCWGWKDRSLGGRRWYYAKLLRRRATLVAPRLWGHFYALTENYGDLTDYMEQVEAGNMTHEARQIYEALLAHGPLGTVALRAAVGMDAPSSKSRFERGLVELEIDMKVMPVAVGDEGAWRYSFIYDIPMRHYPDLPDMARGLETGEVWQTLIGEYIDAVVAASTREIAALFHIFKPTQRELDRALQVLVAAGRIEEAQTTNGKAPLHVWVSTRALAFDPD
ncbi:MAG: hypothetical protein Kow0077_02270 [Anaerolineae bacterium]